MQGDNRPVAWCVWDHFQVVRSKTFENDVCFRLLPLLLGSAGLGGVIPGQVASLDVEFAHLEVLCVQPIPQAHFLP